MKSVNNTILQLGLLKLERNSLYDFDESIKNELIHREGDARNHKLGIWSAYESDSED